MIKHIKIRANNIFVDQRLDLGKINVICGKNNSGKSKLLNSIYQNDLHAIGFKTTENRIKFIYDSSHEQGTWQRHEIRRSADMHYIRIIREIIESKDVWFSDEGYEFSKLVIDLLHRTIGTDQFSIREDIVVASFMKAYSHDLKSVLLPPKRIIQLGSPIKAGDFKKVSGDGNGLIEYLFHAKNQPPNSSDWRIFDKLSRYFEEISSGYIFNIFSESASNSIVLQFSNDNKNWISANDCGLGLQDLLIILTFAIHPEYKTILLEEPESHLHPATQKKLISFLQEDTNKLYFITTHSNVFLNNNFVDKVFFTTYSGKITVDDATSRATILNDLGYSVTDNLVSDLIILVEGPSDKPVVEHFLAEMGIFSRYDIKVWPLGGDNMQHLDLSIFHEKYRIMALIDQDPGSDKIRNQFQRRCKKLGIPCHRLSRYATENYFTIPAMKAALKGDYPDEVVEIKPDQPVGNQIGKEVKGNNRRIVRHMTLDDIKDTDLFEFFEQVAELCHQLDTSSERA